MNRLLFVCLLFLGFSAEAIAHPFAPPTLEWLSGSDAVYVVRVQSIKILNDGYKTPSVEFSIGEVLRGTSRKTITLSAAEGYPFKNKSEYILIHNPSGFKDQVGFTIEGDPEWWPIEVTGEGDKATCELGSLPVVRRYIHDHPPGTKTN